MKKLKSWDLWGVVISGICVVHCLAVPVVLLLFPTVGISLFPQEDITHVVLLGFILGVAGVAFITGYPVHGQWPPVLWLMLGLVFIFFATFLAHDLIGHNWEPVFAILGSLALIRAHYLNHHCVKCEREHKRHQQPNL